MYSPQIIETTEVIIINSAGPSAVKRIVNMTWNGKNQFSNLTNYLALLTIEQTIPVSSLPIIYIIWNQCFFGNPQVQHHSNLHIGHFICGHPPDFSIMAEHFGQLFNLTPF